MGREEIPEESALKEAALSLPLTSEVDMKIARDGRWYHDGSLIGRKPLVRLFSTVLKRDDDGCYWLVTPVEKAKIKVEDVPFIVVELRNEGKGEEQNISFRNNVDSWFDLDRQHPIRFDIKDENDGPTPYVIVREDLEARILRPVYYQLIKLAEVRDGKMGIWSKGKFHVLGSIE